MESGLQHWVLELIFPHLICEAYPCLVSWECISALESGGSPSQCPHRHTTELGGEMSICGWTGTSPLPNPVPGQGF